MVYIRLPSTAGNVCCYHLATIINIGLGICLTHEILEFHKKGEHMPGKERVFGSRFETVIAVDHNRGRKHIKRYRT